MVRTERTISGFGATIGVGSAFRFGRAAAPSGSEVRAAAGCASSRAGGGAATSYSLRLSLEARVTSKARPVRKAYPRSEEHTSEIQLLMSTSYAVSGLKQKE